MNARCGGFTLVELVITMTLTVLVTAFAAMFVAGPVRGYTDQVRRVELVDAAASALHRFSRDARRALPNSIRVTPVGTGFAVEMFNTVDGARYRVSPPPADTTKTLEFGGADDQFNAVGGFARTAKPFSSSTHFLSVYNAGVPGASAWELANVITPSGSQIDIAVDALPGEDHVTITPPFQFAFPSPTRRIYLVDEPVTWLCNPAAETLDRYSGYTPASDQTSRDSNAELLAAGARVTRVADDVVSCQLGYTPGTAWRSGLVSARLEIERDNERVALLQQIHVENAP